MLSTLAAALDGTASQAEPAGRVGLEVTSATFSKCYPCFRLTLLPMFPVGPFTWPGMRAQACRAGLLGQAKDSQGVPMSKAPRRVGRQLNKDGPEEVNDPLVVLGFSTIRPD